MTLTTPFSGTVCHQQAATCYYKSTHQIWSTYLQPLRKCERRRKMLKMGWFRVLRSPKVIENSAVRQSAHEFLLAFDSNCVPILHHFWDITRYLWKSADVNLPHLYLAPPLGVMSLEFHQDFWYRKTRVSGLSYAVLSDPRFSHLCTTPTCDRQTDRRTDRQTHNDS